MAGAVHNTQHEFWRPPAAVASTPVNRIEVCSGCGAEFMVNSHYCHVCGTARGRVALSSDPKWMRTLHILEFQNLKRVLGLSTASLIAFCIGLGCLLGALAVSMVYSVQNFGDFQAIQWWRMQWLLAAVAAFVAGILLKRPADH
ncbi:MAG: hypothetical protein JST79_03095 [Acidobacteria bacterium]|nr:hypothetical protein [Acidobacteriota bacterium]